MAKKQTYKLVNVTVKHPKIGNIEKVNIEYYEDGVLDSVEHYSVKGKENETVHKIKTGFIKEN